MELFVTTTQHDIAIALERTTPGRTIWPVEIALYRELRALYIAVKTVELSTTGAPILRVTFESGRYTNVPLLRAPDMSAAYSTSLHTFKLHLAGINPPGRARRRPWYIKLWHRIRRF